jgi:sec-independent protein translocase protein TatC
MSFLQHLEELRRRLIRIILILTAGTTLCLIFADRLVEFLTSTFPATDTVHLALLQPTEGFMVYLKVALIGGIFLTTPFWLWQFWGFISPGLYDRERRVIIPVVAASSAAFLLGATFGYFILPYGVKYFLSFTTQGMIVTWSLAKYVSFELQILVAFGLTFELPLVIYAAAMLGIVTPAQLRHYRRHAIVAILIVGGIITPPDVLSQIAVSAPLIILYEVGIILAAAALRRRAARGHR